MNESPALIVGLGNPGREYRLNRHNAGFLAVDRLVHRRGWPAFTRKQSNALVSAPKVWDVARAIDPAFTVANLFWWFNMYSTADYSVTPRPMYPADGRKVPDVYTSPASLRDELQRALGTFPLFEFWGPRASIRSTQWIADSAKLVEGRFHPTLTLVYLPHLDYNLQRLGPTHNAFAPRSRRSALRATAGKRGF